MNAVGIAAVAAAEPHRVAIVSGEVRWSYRDLDDRINRLARHLTDLGVRPGDRVAVMLRNRPEVLVAWNAVARLGGTPVPVSYRFTAPEVSYLVADSEAVALVHERDVDPAAVQGSDHYRGALDVDAISLDDGAASPVDPRFVNAAVVPMTYTSGTTGRPKGIARPGPDPAAPATVNPIALFWGFTADDVHLLCGPAYHTAPGMYAQMHLGLGARVVMMTPFDADECLRLIETERVTTTHMVPANFVRILDADWQRYDVSSVRRVLHAGAPCPVPVKRRILDVFPAGSVWEYYGMSEGMGTVISPEEWLRKPGSVGRAFPGLTVRILSEDGAELPPGEVGLVYVSSVPGYGFGYHNDETKTAEAWRGAFFTVGDLGALDPDGYLFLADRRTDLIISGGVNIYPAEVEQALCEHPAVADAAVLGLPDERMGQRVHAIVQLRDGVECEPQRLIDDARGWLSTVKLPRTVEIVERIPREPNGKVLKARLAAERSG